MEKDIIQHLKNELKHVINKSNIETEARLGHFSREGDFYPGVSEYYFNDMKNTLMKLIPSQNITHKESVATYFTDGLRSETFTSGNIESIKKRKITNDIDMNFPKHYSLRISTSKEKPYQNPVLDATIRKILKPKSTPKLLSQGSLFKFKHGCIIFYKNRQRNSKEGWNDLTWRYTDPDWLITLSGNKKRLREKDSHFTSKDWVEMISMAGKIKGTPVPMGKYTVKCHILNLMPLTSIGNATRTPPFVPTSWRSKKRISFTLWEGLSIDMTETVYSKYSIQHCYDGRGKKTYEVEADWDLQLKNINDFAKVIKHVLYSKA